MAMYSRFPLACLSMCLLAPGAASAQQQAPFDLTGPVLQVSVTHEGETLPISQVPNLSAGDQVSIRADLPKDQEAHYLLVAAFLRGATNPPPKKWVFEAKTWKRKKNALEIKVPEGARQLVLFLAPETGGDFDALQDVVRGRPGAFVRASQDLNQASLDRSRLDAFLVGIQNLNPADPDRLEAVSPLLARSLSMKFNADCLQKMPELQGACLTEDRESLVLNDNHSASITEALIGAPADLAMQLSATPQGGLGYYSPYIGVVRDVARILGAFHTADYQYIPALSIHRGGDTALLLNAVPSFSKPKSVLVAALPAIETPRLPPLQPATESEPLCAAQPGLVLPVDGAPLIYSTRYARNMVLRLKAKDGRAVDLPVTARAEKGGFVADVSKFQSTDFGETIEATLRGYWGFQPFDGPQFVLQNPASQSWQADDKASLVTGRDNNLQLRGTASACVESVALRDSSGTAKAVEWKAGDASTVSVKIPMADARAGQMTLLVKQYGMAAPASVTLNAYAQASRIDALTLHAGDQSGILTGTRLDGVASVSVDGLVFQAGELKRVGDTDQLSVAAADAPSAAKLQSGQSKSAKVALKDGRTVDLPVTIAPHRPTATLLGKSVQRPSSSTPISIKLTGDDMVPQGARLTFSVRAAAGTRFTGRETVEIEASNGNAPAKLNAGNGLRLENTEIALATFDPAKDLGSFAFGDLRFRILQNGVEGDWQSLGTLVRLPELREINCDDSADSCTLTGSNLFLIDAVADNATFSQPSAVPPGFTGAELKVPRPKDDQLYLKLRDDPKAISTVVIPAPMSASR